MKRFPPRGYKETDKPLDHEGWQHFSLHAEGTTKNSTIVPLFKMTEECNAPENVEVNPTNDNFAIDGGTACHRGSIIDKLRLEMRMDLSKVAIETDKVRQLEVMWAPIYTAFLDSLDASDEKTGADIETIYELQHETTNKDTFPLYANVKLTGTSMNLSTVGFAEDLGDLGLTTTAVIEAVAMSEIRVLFNQMRYYTNSGMMKKVVPRWHRVRLSRDRPYFTVQRFINKTVKRMNPYTFCGILFTLAQVGSPEQFGLASETTDIDHVNVKMTWNYEEWNTAFEQASI